MPIINNIVCVSGNRLIKSEANPMGVMSKPNYDKLTRDFKKSKMLGVNVIQTGGNGRVAMIAFDSLPPKYRAAFIETFGDPRKETEKSYLIMDQVEVDNRAAKFYADYRLANYEDLPSQVQLQYTYEASILNTLNIIATDRLGSRGGSGNGRVRKADMWKGFTETIHEATFKKRYPHKLPKMAIPLRRKYDKYIKDGYLSLVHSGYCNDNSLKRSILVERLVLSLYVAPNKPFGATVYDTYNLFINGKIEVFDKKTGELFDRFQFVKNGKPIELSESTIWNIINNPKNRILVDEIRNDSLFNSNKHRPFHRRKSPVYSLSKISMDDRDIPRKLHNGKAVKAYYAYDVASGCVIGRSYSLDKNETLFLDCLRDTFRTIDAHGWGMPMEVEVEHHLVDKFFDDLAVMFPYLRICAAGNSREKRAEHLNKAKKYGAEKRSGMPVGRWWAKHEAYYQPTSKVKDEYVIAKGNYDTIVAEDIAAIIAYNNEPHPKKKTYPNMTRWDVLRENINPDLPRRQQNVLARYIGESSRTSIRNSKEVTVQYEQYQLPTPETMSRLAPNNQRVIAYYLKNEQGVIDKVHLYQGDKFIATCGKINPYNEATAEQTDIDRQSIATQSAYDAQYRKMVKDGKDDLYKTDTINIETVDRVAETAIKMASTESLVAPKNRKKKIDIIELLESYDSNATAAAAITNY